MKLINKDNIYVTITLPTKDRPFNFAIRKFKIKNIIKGNLVNGLEVIFINQKLNQTLFVKQTDINKTINDVNKTIILTQHTIMTLCDKQVIKKIIFKKLYDKNNEHNKSHQVIWAYKQLLQNLKQLR